MKKEIIKKIIEEFSEYQLPKIVERQIIKINLDVNKIITIGGSRRVGKTFYIFSIIKKLLAEGIKRERILYINFEDERLLPFSPHDFDILLEAFYELYPETRNTITYFFFDEIQEITMWEKFVRRLYDTQRAKIVITGSSSKVTSKEIASSLRGRSITYELFPFSFNEILSANGIVCDIRTLYSSRRFLVKKLFEEYLKFGGYPEIVLNKEHNIRLRILNEYLSTIIIKDLIEKYKIRSMSTLKGLIKFLISNVSRYFSINSFYKFIKQTTPITKRTLINYIHYLESINLFFFVNKFSPSLKVQSVNPKKLYCIDTGFLTATGFYATADIGWRLENIVYLTLKQRQIVNPLMEIYYWRDNSKEVDFLIKEGNRIKSLIQVSYDIEKRETREREIQGLISAMEKFNLPRGIIITYDYSGEEKIGKRKIFFIPIIQWLISL
ncbi:MAG: ATP-binding protein [candidate division WOR-3 bacterium]